MITGLWHRSSSTTHIAPFATFDQDQREGFVFYIGRAPDDSGGSLTGSLAMAQISCHCVIAVASRHTRGDTGKDDMD